MPLLMVGGCCSRDLTKDITKEISKDIECVEDTVSVINNKLPAECAAFVADDIRSIETQLANIKGKLKTVPEVCSVEKNILKAENQKLSAYMLLLVLLTVSGWALYFRKR